ncbi:MAG: STAS domain-containing protein [Acidobacteriia bacterium]|nr:STAS domain-containing protein [Terriglobia bacterium]
MDDLTIEVEKRASGVRVFRLTGPLTLKTMFDFQDAARAEADSALVVELSGVPYMDSAGLGTLLGVLASCQRHGRGFGITGASDRIQTLFTVSKVAGMIPSFESVETAEQLLSKSATA